MDAVAKAAARLLERAQSGEPEAALREVEQALREPTGDLLDGPAALHFPRIVAMIVLGQHREAITAATVMIEAADRQGCPGWRSNGLSLRAEERLHLGDCDAMEYDVDAILRDLVEAETALADGADDLFAAENAYVGIALGYLGLGLYELALPNYESAYEVSLRLGPDSAGSPAMWQSNIARLHLDWALELYRVGHDADAVKHSQAAGRHALQAAQDAAGPAAQRWRDGALLIAACAKADGPDPASAAAGIREAIGRLGERCLLSEVWYAQPFLAAALSRTGRREEALQIIEQACADPPKDAEWTTLLTLQHTRAVLLAARSEEARAALAYGDVLAGVLWRRRQRTLQAAGALRSYQVLQHQHEEVSRQASTDALTGIANRRAFDDQLLAVQRDPDPDRTVAVMLVDIDRFKQVNDTLGHAGGDQSLSAVAATLAAQVRDGDLVARLGGDEFGALLLGADEATALRIAQRIVAAVDATAACRTSVSVGVSSGPARSVTSTMSRADHQMYAAKRAGGAQASGDRAPETEAPPAAGWAGPGRSLRTVAEPGIIEGCPAA